MASPDRDADGLVIGTVSIRPVTTDGQMALGQFRCGGRFHHLGRRFTALLVLTSQFSRLNPLLGSLGAVTLFFLWSYLMVLTVLLGAQLNAEMERKAWNDATGAPTLRANRARHFVGSAARGGGAHL